MLEHPLVWAIPGEMETPAMSRMKTTAANPFMVDVVHPPVAQRLFKQAQLVWKWDVRVNRPIGALFASARRAEPHPPLSSAECVLGENTQEDSSGLGL